MPPHPLAHKLCPTPKDVTDLCSTAEEAYEKIAPQAKYAWFSWRGRKFKAGSTGIRLIVMTLSGIPIASKFTL